MIWPLEILLAVLLLVCAAVFTHLQAEVEWIGLGLYLLLSLLGYLLVLYRLGLEPKVNVATALWGTLPGLAFFVSYYPYVGFIFLPVEIVGSAILVRLRSKMPWLQALALAGSVHLFTIFLPTAVVVAFRSLSSPSLVPSLVPPYFPTPKY